MVAVKKPAKRVRMVKIRYTREYEFNIPAEQLPKPMKRHGTHPAIMGCGHCGKDKPIRVIDNGRVMCYVGIGWVVEEENATPDDYRKYPRVID